jgi:hypothetical protein
LHARVRNIGDQDLTDVRVQFFFAPYGTNLPPLLSRWQPCVDVAGKECILEIPVLPAASMNIADVDNPPPNQSVAWYLDPSYVTPDVDHFCLRAVIECSARNHEHDVPAGVQTSIRHVAIRPGEPVNLALQIHNLEWTPLRVNMRVEHTLPTGYHVRHRGSVPLRRTFVARDEPRNTRWQLTGPRRRPDWLAPPYAGRAAGGAKGGISGFLDAQLSDVRTVRERRSLGLRASAVELEGMLAGTIQREADAVSVIGRFAGTLDLRTAALTGRFRGTATCQDGRLWPGIELDVDGCLEPLRAVHFSQLVGGEPLGGATVHVRMPRLRGQLDPEDWR